VRYAVISDVHGNLEALKNVLDHIGARGINTIFCLGDIIGYGPNPVECTELIMQNCFVCVKGNHDEAISEGIYLFNPVAKKALQWSKKILETSSNPKRQEIWDYLCDLPLWFVMNEYMFIHGSPLDPTSDYILAKSAQSEPEKLHKIFQEVDQTLFCGHTHVPGVITDQLEFLSLADLDYKYMIEDSKAIINVGSVGQSRDGDPRSCYVEVIDNMVFFHRIAYNYNKVAEQIFANDSLDDFLGQRLMSGK
jgi:predicted phosphodiesterase